MSKVFVKSKSAVGTKHSPNFAPKQVQANCRHKKANKHSWKKEELEAYDYSAMREQDKRGKLVQAEKKGEKKRENEIARDMKKEGEPIEKIVKYTGLTLKEIDEI